MLLSDEILVERLPDLCEHGLGEEVFLQHFLIHEVDTDRSTHRGRYASLFLGDDARRERHFVPQDVLRLMGAEEHPDGNVISDVANDAAYERSDDKSDHASMIMVVVN